jgi:hypothetical protein
VQVVEAVGDGRSPVGGAAVMAAVAGGDVRHALRLGAPERAGCRLGRTGGQRAGCGSSAARYWMIERNAVPTLTPYVYGPDHTHEVAANYACPAASDQARRSPPRLRLDGVLRAVLIKSAVLG